MHHKVWYKTPLYLTFLMTLIFVATGLTFPQINPVLHAFMSYWKLIWWAILLGLVMAGLIDALVPNNYVTHYLSRPGRISIVNATILGFILSACSHGLLAVAMELYKKGASTSSVISFLMASPWANMGITLLLIGFFGLKALCFIVSALIIAIVTGFIYQELERKNFVETNPYKPKHQNNFSVLHDVKKRWKKWQFSRGALANQSLDVIKGSWHSAHMVLWWVIIGTLLGSFVEVFVPIDFMQEYMGPSILGLGVTLLIATVIEVCSEGSSPLAFTIYKQTGAFGNSFVFLMAGVITDVTELGLIWTNIGKKAAIWLPIITIPQAILVGYILNLIL